MKYGIWTYVDRVSQVTNYGLKKAVVIIHFIAFVLLFLVKRSVLFSVYNIQYVRVLFLEFLFRE